MLELIERNVIKTKSIATDFNFTFKERYSSEEEYESLKDRLDNFIFNLSSDYSVESECKYNEDLKTLIMDITVVIPDRLVPSHPLKKIRLIVDLQERFLKFYENEKKIK
ncbi:hypothetical protein [Methanobacterium ferruginis]|uniref:hypothetical protein n=1 Tax=Methanobacterium ferruginis TaxID=710191 RepID=UPI00257444C2|nr:hypothetical protein [Methanobacterium ferruginis]BDZ68603.1 hypothetical protein GCM10025860_20510 [Methanobacterium ferruginis]